MNSSHTVWNVNTPSVQGLFNSSYSLFQFEGSDIISVLKSSTEYSSVFFKCLLVKSCHHRNTVNFFQFHDGNVFFKGNLRSKKSLAQMKEREKCKKTSHHRPQCAKWFSRYSISKSGIWTRWTSPFCRFSASFSIKYDVTDAILQDNEKMKVQYLRSLLFDLFETLQAVRTWQRNFKFCCYGNQNQAYCLLLKKQKVYCLSKSDVRKVIWNNTVWLLLQVVWSFEDKWVIHSSYCEKTIVFCFWIKANYYRLSCPSNEI